AQAAPFYRKAYEQIKAFPTSQQKDWLVAVSFADFLMDWSSATELDAAAVLFNEGLGILDAGLADPRVKANAATLSIRKANMLRKHAGRLDKEAAKAYYDRARECCSFMESADNRFMAEYTLATLAFEQSRKLVEREDELIAAGERHFETA